MRIALVLLYIAVQTGGVVRTADPIKRGMTLADFPRTVKVADNVYTYEDFHAGDEKFTTTNMFVVTDGGVIVADGQGSPEATKGLVDAIAKVTPKPIRYIVICSDHGDHTGGNEAFPPEVTYIIHPESKAILERAAENARTNGRPVRWQLPETAILVEGKQTFLMGSTQFDVMFLGRAHTGGDLAVWLPRQKILFLSEIFLNRVFPAMRSAYPGEWLKTLDRAKAMKADVDIPGHGFTEKASASRQELGEYQKAMAAVIKEATRLHTARVPVDEAPNQANWGEYWKWTLARSQAPIAIRRVYDELDGKLK